MISALSLLLAAGMQVQTPAVDLDQLVQASNRLRYTLPESTTHLGFRAEKGAGSIREARRGGAEHAQFRRDDMLSLETFNDGKRLITLEFDRRIYSDLARTAPAATYEEAVKEPLDELKEDQFDMRFESGRGLVLRSRPAIQVLNDEPSVTVEGEERRRLTCRVDRPGDATTDNPMTVDFRVLIDRTGLIRKIEGEMKSKKEGDMTFLFTCDPAVPADEPFTFDVSRLKDWTKASTGSGS